jgi:hypothetical protein
MRQRAMKRVTVSVDVDIPAAMTIGATEKWVQGRFPKGAHARCHEQRMYRPEPGRAATDWSGK